MRFLTDGQCAQWCGQRGYVLPETLRHRAGGGHNRHDFSIPPDAGHRVELCRILWDIADEADATERLLWITGWRVWSEHMPLFRLVRRALGEERELIEVPGHVVEPSETADGLSLLLLGCFFLWDCWLYSSSGVVIEIHNDEGGTIYEPARTRRLDRPTALAPFRQPDSSRA